MICPNCQTDVKVTEQNYGSLFTCPSCQAAYFINFEGQAEFGEMNQESVPVGTAQTLEAPIQESSAFAGELSATTSLEDMTPVNEFAQISELLFEPMQMIPLDQPEPVPMNSFAQAAQDISDFGNSETQVASLNYDLKISGLDTIEILKLFKEAIEDSRFGWETNSLMKSIKNGEISLLKLNPVKAYILAKRLQFLDIEKKWNQNVLS